jgi:CRISPR-associated Csx2 family protein
MARKVFISFLGTNNYVLCRYAMDDVVSGPVRFVQEALIENLCKDWAEADRIFIFCTSKESTGELGSKEINWLDNGQARATDKSEKIGLQHRRQDLQARIGLKPQIEQLDIEAGFSEEAIWNIFNTVYSKLQPQDQIYFDVTHAFRSIPLFSVVLFNYSKMMIGTQLMSIMYGAFEKLGPAFKVKELPVSERVAPVIDLTNIARLQEYNQIAGSQKGFGKVKQLKEAIASELAESSSQAVRDLCNSISELDEYIATINIKAIKTGKFVSKFRNNYKNVKKRMALTGPLGNLLDELNRETADFVGENNCRNIEAAINWTIKHDMLMQAYPMAEEYIVLRVADMFKDIKPSQLSPKKFREFISGILGAPKEDFLNKSWKFCLADFPDVADELSDDFLIRELRPLYDPIRQSRNALAHANGIGYEELRKGIPNIIECIKHLNAAYESYPSTKYILDNLEKK